MNEIDEIFDSLDSFSEGLDLPFEKGDDVWLPRGSEPLKIKEMSDSHLVNSINFWMDRYWPGWDILDSIEDQKLQKKFSQALSHVAAMINFPKYKYLWEEATKRGLVK